MKLFDFSQYDQQPRPVPSGEVQVITDGDEAFDPLVIENWK